MRVKVSFRLASNRCLRCSVETVRDKENAILAAAEKLEGKILTPWAERVFEIHSYVTRTCRIGNGNVVPVIYPDAEVEVARERLPERITPPC
ncbi:unnamed protein product [Bathycoccus prasinos]